MFEFPDFIEDLSSNTIHERPWDKNAYVVFSSSMESISIYILFLP
jgi:hypothetical protein